MNSVECNEVLSASQLSQHSEVQATAAYPSFVRCFWIFDKHFIGKRRTFTLWMQQAVLVGTPDGMPAESGEERFVHGAELEARMGASSC